MEIVLSTLFIIICLLLIVVVLLQKGRGGGLSAAFGGGSSSAFGTRTGDFFTWVTIVLTGLFLLLAVFTTLAFRPSTVVPPPQLIPSAGPNTKPKQVTFAKSKQAKTDIYYTTNGSAPSKDSTKYTGVFDVKPGETVKAIAIHAGNTSPVTEWTYTAENTEPEPTPSPTSSTTSAPAEAPAKPATSTPAVVPG